MRRSAKTPLIVVGFLEYSPGQLRTSQFCLSFPSTDCDYRCALHPNVVFSPCSLQACDDECVGALLNDLDSIGDAVLSLNLAGVSLAPYGTLENLENTTKYFQVGARGMEMVDRNICH